MPTVKCEKVACPYNEDFICTYEGTIAIRVNSVDGMRTIATECPTMRVVGA